MIELIINWMRYTFVGMICLFFLFVIIMGLKYAIIRNGWQDNKVMQILSLVFSRAFNFVDICANYFVFAPIVLHWPNQWHEGRTISAHANTIIGEYLADEDPDAGWLDDWRFDVSMFVCKHLNNIDDGHCGNLK